ncbi:MAG: DUF3024 domain-containing protein [Bacteroidota bacterium]
MIEVDLIEQIIKQHLEKIRPPVEIRDQLDLSYNYDKGVVELIEIRPRWRREGIMKIPYARAKYVKSRQLWKVYWMRASGKWELYSPQEEVPKIMDFLKLVDEDKHHCFKG